MVVRDPGPPGFAAAADAAEPPSTSTVTSWSKEAAGPCPPSLHSGREEEERVVRGGARGPAESATVSQPPQRPAHPSFSRLTGQNSVRSPRPVSGEAAERAVHSGQRRGWLKSGF